MTAPRLIRRPDWQARLACCLNARAAEPYRYGENDCWLVAREAVEAVTGTLLFPEMPPYRGWVAAARIMISRGWETIEDMATALLGVPVDPDGSTPGDIVSFEEGGEPHLAVRIGDAAVTPTLRGTQVVERAAWRRGWKVG